MGETLTEADPLLSFEISEIFDNYYNVIVHDDDVTTFETVIKALMTIFNYDAGTSEKLAWKVHTEGRAVVALLPKDEAENSVSKLHSYKIQASISKVT
jgi:ATP-dependent Clp protease adaptor protein ClpS